MKEVMNGNRANQVNTTDRVNYANNANHAGNTSTSLHYNTDTLLSGRATLRDIKALLPRTEGKALSTAKQLRENGEVLICERFNNGYIQVFTSGFAVYSADRHTHVLRVDKVCTYNYEFVMGDESMSLDDEPWAAALMLVGDQRSTAFVNDRTGRRNVGFVDDYDDEDSEDRDQPIAGQSGAHEENARSMRRRERRGYSR